MCVASRVRILADACVVAVDFVVAAVVLGGGGLGDFFGGVHDGFAGGAG